MARVTFSLSEETVAQIRQTAARLRKPQSHVVREAVAEYSARSGRLSEAERSRALALLERLRGAPRSRSAAEVDDEIRSVRTGRRAGGRRRRSR